MTEPSVTPLHTTTITSDEPVRVDVHVGDGRWFRVLNWLIDSGAWAGLSAAARSVFIVLSRHATHEGVASLGIRDLVRHAAYGRSAVYDALSELVAHPAGLLEVLSPSAWRLVPGRRFRSRESTPADNRPPWRTTPSAPADNHASPSLPAPLSPSAQRDNSSRQTAAAAAGLIEEGFDPGTAEQITRSTRCTPEGLATVRRNADWLSAQGRLRNRRGFIRSQLSRGPTLFAEVEAADREQAERRRRRDEYLAAMAAWVEELLSQLTLGERRAIEARLGDAAAIVAARLVHPADFNFRDGSRVIDRLREQA